LIDTGSAANFSIGPELRSLPELAWEPVVELALLRLCFVQPGGLPTRQPQCKHHGANRILRSLVPLLASRERVEAVLALFAPPSPQRPRAACLGCWPTLKEASPSAAEQVLAEARLGAIEVGRWARHDPDPGNNNPCTTIELGPPAGWHTTQAIVCSPTPS
jgi:hypothetical protein